MTLQENIQQKSTSTNSIIDVRNLSFAYNRDNPIFEQINLQINSGEILGIAGESGIGKTTFAYILKGIIPLAIKGTYYSGEVQIDGHLVHKSKLADLAPSIGMVFQDLNAQLFSNTVLEEVEFGLHNLKLDSQRAITALQELNILDLKDRIPMNLSAGQKQRVILASVIALQPKILILDEPSIHLDYKNKISLCKWLYKLHQQKQMTILIASNDPWLIGNLCQEILYIQDTKITRLHKSELMAKQPNWMWKYAQKEKNG
ncbi:MAG: ATP-binding protein [Promethearchaeia archaeon]|nr:MAG: ATP-binding protein [Candidatus Lokiarchaeia archaeon]